MTQKSGRHGGKAWWQAATQTDRRPLQADRTPAKDGSEIGEECVRFALAMDRFKRKHQRPFPTCSEVLGVLKGIGYQRVEPGCVVVRLFTQAEAVFAEGGGI